MKNLPHIFSSSIGNIIEWYDFGLFTIYSAIFSKIFFPSTKPSLAMLATLTIFAIGFICRPIGGLIYGYLGDRYGRAITLRWSILMIAIPTFLVCLIPSYQQVGTLAPILFLIVRMWQGVTIGGEYSGNLIYLAESAPYNKRALVTTLAAMGANFGILMAGVVGMATNYLFTPSGNELYGWRIAYALSGLLTLFIYFLRYNLKETSVFSKLKSDRIVIVNPVKYLLRHNKKSLFINFGLLCMGCTFYYFSFVYIPLYLVTKACLKQDAVSNIITFSIILMIVFAPLGAMICDYIGRRKMLLFNALFVSAVIIPGFYLLHSGQLFIILLVLCIFAFGSAFEQSTTPISIIENLPIGTRYTGLALCYNLANGILGGTIPLISQWLIITTEFNLAPAFYVTSFALLSGLVALIYFPKTT